MYVTVIVCLPRGVSVVVRTVIVLPSSLRLRASRLFISKLARPVSIESAFIYLKLFTLLTAGGFYLVLRLALVALGLRTPQRIVLLLLTGFSFSIWFHFSAFRDPRHGVAGAVDLFRLAAGSAGLPAPVTVTPASHDLDTRGCVAVAEIAPVC